jgi:site-specific recombinase XerD
MKVDLHGLLGEPINAFVQQKRALSRKYLTEAAALRLLDRYVTELGITAWQQIDGRVIDTFLASRPRRRPRSYNHLLALTHRFFDWAVVHQLTDHNPVILRPRRETSACIPYLFGLDDARRLLESARGLHDRSRAPRRALVYETVFALLYGLGMRVGEVTHLLVGDIDLERATLFIRDTKFSKSRLVPFGPRIGRRLADYMDASFGTERDRDRPLFSFTKRGPIHECTVSATFHSLVPHLGLNIPDGVAPPHLHDLRRAFAVGTLLRWYREGVDPNQRLIQLSTFLGHTDPTSTAVYLTITEELLREADRRFRAFAMKGGGL